MIIFNLLCYSRDVGLQKSGSSIIVHFCPAWSHNRKLKYMFMISEDEDPQKQSFNKQSPTLDSQLGSFL
jgi:hypothetical protein